MLTNSELGKILVACRFVSVHRWLSAEQVGEGDLHRTLDAIASKPPEWWVAEQEGEEPPRGLTDYQRGVIELLFETGDESLTRNLILNRFVLLEKLGEGGQGEVYKARQLSPARYVAVKTLTESNETGRLRFEQEARAMMRIQHPGIARFYLYERVRDPHNQPTDEYLIAMEYVDGIDLARLVLEVGLIPWEFVTRWAICLLEGLAVIHQSGLIHRDIKPANVMVIGYSGQSHDSQATSAKLLDFGAVKRTSERDRSTRRKKLFVGTREYAPPEQWHERVVHASDLYALGGTLYFALTGEPPYTVENRDAAAFMKAHAQAPIPDVCEINSNVPPALGRLIRRMLAKNPEDRGTASELLLEVRQFFSHGELARISSSTRARSVKKSADKRHERKSDNEESAPAVGFGEHMLQFLERALLPRHLRPATEDGHAVSDRLIAILRRPLTLLLLTVIVIALIVLLI